MPATLIKSFNGVDLFEDADGFSVYVDHELLCGDTNEEHARWLANQAVKARQARPTFTSPARPDCPVCEGSGRDADFRSACNCDANFRGARRAHDAATIDAPVPAAHTNSGNGSARQGTRRDDRVRGPEAKALAAWLAEQTWSTFAHSLAESYVEYGCFTAKQFAAASSMKAKCLARQAETVAETVAPEAPQADVPAGWYAIKSTGDNDLAFYKVEKGEGKWAGRTFVMLVVGGQADRNVPRNQVAGILARIAADPEAGPRFGREIGKCWKCHRHLTDEVSRAAGIGPDCAKRVGS